MNSGEPSIEGPSSKTIYRYPISITNVGNNKLIQFLRYTTIAYVQQTPWLMRTSIRENILFGEAYRPRRYDKVLASCALKEDLRCLPDGDLTEIGANGINLSGGQKQRIAIARALYSSANVVIMVTRKERMKKINIV